MVTLTSAKNPGDLARLAVGPNVFLPDFCGKSVVFSVVIIGQLLGFVLVISGLDSPRALGADGRNLLAELALTSLFVQWVGLSSAAILCGCRRRLAKTTDAVASVASFAVVLVVTAVATEVGFWAVRSRWGGAWTRAPVGAMGSGLVCPRWRAVK